MNSKSFLLNWKSFSLPRSDLLLLLWVLGHRELGELREPGIGNRNPTTGTATATGTHNCGKHLQIQMARRGLQSEEIMYNGQNIQIRTRIPMCTHISGHIYVHTCIILRNVSPIRTTHHPQPTTHHPLPLFRSPLFYVSIAPRHRKCSKCHISAPHWQRRGGVWVVRVGGGWLGGGALH